MRRADVVTGVVLVVLGAFALSMGLDMGVFGEKKGPGPGFFPTVLSAALVVLGALLAIGGLRAREVRTHAAGGIRTATRAAGTPARDTEDSAAGQAVATDARSGPATTATAQAGAPDGGRRRVSRPVAVWVAFALAVAILPVLGFVLTAVLLLAGLLYGIERRRSFLPLIAVVAIPVVLYEVFVDLLAIPLPAGVIGLGVLGI